MPMKPRDRLLDHLRRIALRGIGERCSDGQLLEQFIAERDETAFALLLRRHGPMVWSVCRRVLGNSHDADDAFQAAFLVLVRKAASVRPRESVGNWLYGVAYRTALAAHRRTARRRAKEQSLQDVSPPESKSVEPWQELWPILDRELSRLADKYRLPFVLCDLEGRSRKDVARQLAIPEGTLSSRLDTARKKLAARLARLGFTLSGVSLAALLTEKTATAAIAPSLFTTTTKAAMLVAAGSAAVGGGISATVATLTEGVLKTMFIAKIKTATLMVCSVAALGVGTGGVYYQTRAKAADSTGAIQSDEKPSAKPIRSSERSQDDRRQIAEKSAIQLALEREEARVREQELLALRAKLLDQMAKMQAKINVIQKELAAEKSQEQLRPQSQRKGPPPLRDVDARRSQIMDEYTKELDEVRQQKEVLDKKEELLRQRVLRQIEAFNNRRAKMIADQTANQPNQKESQKPASGDKLDQILERLERLEKRLDRLERGRQ